MYGPETVHTFKILPIMSIVLSLYPSVCAYGNSTGISITSVCSSSVRHHLAVGLSNGDVKVFVRESPEKEDSPNTLAQTKVTAIMSLLDYPIGKQSALTILLFQIHYNMHCFFGMHLNFTHIQFIAHWCTLIVNWLTTYRFTVFL